MDIDMITTTTITTSITVAQPQQQQSQSIKILCSALFNPPKLANTLEDHTTTIPLEIIAIYWHNSNNKQQETTSQFQNKLETQIPHSPNSLDNVTPITTSTAIGEDFPNFYLEKLDRIQVTAICNNEYAARQPLVDIIYNPPELTHLSLSYCRTKCKQYQKVVN
ncbi:hypothetical protein ACTFIW_001544 [Dictyostelium discoideum]